jgi:hypothetical protein
MNTVKLARRFAFVGFLVSISFFFFWYLDDKFNFFHLPTVENPPPGNYSEPYLRALLEKLNFIVCPPLFITFFGMDLGLSVNLVLEVIVVVLNTALYFVLGLLCGTVWNGAARLRVK